MSLWQFLHDASLPQWIGAWVLAGIIASWRPIVVVRGEPKGDA